MEHARGGVCLSVEIRQGLETQNGCLQGVPGIKGDRGEPGQRGLDGSPVSPCPVGLVCAGTWVSRVCPMCGAGVGAALDCLASVQLSGGEEKLALGTRPVQP